jgi:hypothetical protein
MRTLMTELAIITSRLDAQAADIWQVMQRDAVRDHLVLIAFNPPLLPSRPTHAPPPPAKHPNMFAPLAGPDARGGHRPTIDPNVVDRAACESADLDKDSTNRSMKMNVQVMGLLALASRCLVLMYKVAIYHPST